MKNNIIDPYELCLCGSGKKYKFCCYKREDKNFHNSNEFKYYIQKNIKRISICIKQDCFCKGEIINSHSIQNSKVLSNLSVDNHVYITDDSSNSGIAGNDLKKYGRNKATTSMSFCSFHDNEIFKPIELSDYTYTKKQNFLYAYRAFAKHYYDMNANLNKQQLIFKTIPKTYANNLQMVTYLRGVNVECEKHEKLRNFFNSSLDTKNFSILDTYVIDLDYEIKFATTYMAPLSFNLNGEQISNLFSLTDDMRYIFVTMFPENNKSHILISWLNRDSKYIEKFIKEIDILRKNNMDKLINVLNNMLVSQTDNFVISPKLVDNWDEQKRKNFLALYVSTFLGTESIQNLGQEVEKNLANYQCKFNLFEK